MKPANLTTHPNHGRWLPLLARLMTLYQPIVIGLLTSRAVGSLAIRGREVLVLLLVRVLVTAFGVGAGLALKGRHARSIGLGKTSLLLSGVTELFIVLTPSFPNRRGPGETPIWVAGILIYFGGWFAYLMRSPDPKP